MRLTSLEFRGLTRFNNTVSLDLESLGDGLIAFVGINGSGKTTTAESAPACLFRSFPTRPGSLYDHCNGSDAYIETQWSDNSDRKVVVNLKIDAQRRKTEGYITIDGEPVTDGRSASFEEMIGAMFGSSELFMASVFAAQDKSGNFLTMKRVERKSLFAGLSMLGHLETMAVSSREELAKSAGKLSKLRDELCRISLVADKRESLSKEVVSLELIASAGGVKLVVLEKDLDRARKAEIVAESIVGSYTAKLNARDELWKVLDDVTQRLKEAEAARTLTHLDAAKLRQSIADRNVGHLELKALDKHAYSIALIERNVERLKEDAKRIPAVEGHIETIAKMEVELEVVRGKEKMNISDKLSLGVAERAVDDATSAIIRAEKSAGLLGEVSCLDVPNFLSTCPLLEVANTDSDSIPALEEERTRQSGIADDISLRLNSDYRQINRSQIDIEKIILSFKEELRQAEMLPGIELELVDLEDRVEATDSLYDDDMMTAREEVAKADKEIASLDESTKEALSNADKIISDLEVRTSDSRDAFKKAEADISDSGQDSADKIKADVILAKDAIFWHKSILDKSKAKLIEFETLLNIAERAETDQGLTKLEVSVEECNMTEWTLLEEALGQKGIQAIEIDAVGPEVAELTNDLLSSCYGARFSIRFDTLREKKSGDGFTEVFDVTVYDNGVSRLVESLSGGERVIVGEAVSLALAIFNSRKSSIRYRTLWRDETAGALDLDNASAYVEMLRRARKIGGFSQIIFVAHLPQVYDSADVRVYIRDGGLSLTESENLSVET